MIRLAAHVSDMERKGLAYLLLDRGIPALRDAKFEIGNKRRRQADLRREGGIG